MKRWEYRIVTDSSKLNDLGHEGWELVSVIMKEEHEVFYLKRAALSLRERITLEQRERALEGNEKI